jgi:SAM-dependent methyltransferase
MSIALRLYRELNRDQLDQLERDLAAFYRNAPAVYYELADRAAQSYNVREQPFHCDLVQRVSAAMSVVEIGCGTAHLCPHVEARQAHYTGVDYSDQLLENNRRRFPKARFFRVGELPSEQFDLVASLYTIEHIVHPLRYLEQMWNHCKAGGLLAIICPDFVESPALPPSVFYGRTPRRLRQKLKAVDVLDAWRHIVDLKFVGPRWKRQAAALGPGAFWINLLPRELHGAEHSIDADAVHLPRLKDLVSWFQQKGAEIVASSDTLPNVSFDVRQFNCYVLARRPDAGA